MKMLTKGFWHATVRWPNFDGQSKNMSKSHDSRNNMDNGE